jgi:hypothetical protein
MNKFIYVLLGIFLAMLIFPVVMDFADDRVDVEIYKSDETGEMIYCESGSLSLDSHTYMGSGKISVDKAVAC